VKAAANAKRGAALKGNQNAAKNKGENSGASNGGTTVSDDDKPKKSKKKRERTTAKLAEMAGGSRSEYERQKHLRKNRSGNGNRKCHAHLRRRSVSSEMTLST
jgi:hypothetical protein